MTAVAAAGVPTPAKLAALRPALTWVTGILKRKPVDHWRGVAREAPLPEADADGDPDLLDRLFRADGHRANPPWPRDDPGEGLSQAGFLAVFEACLKGLAGQAGRVFAMREVLELEADGICKDLGLTPSNYWVLMHRARLLRQAARWLAARALAPGAEGPPPAR